MQQWKQLKISDVVDLKGATSIGKSRPISQGPISLAPPKISSVLLR